MSNMLSGGCLCGEVRFELKEEFNAFYQCHCKQCQVLTGSAFASNLFSSVKNIRWLAGHEFVVSYVHPTRAFSKSFCQKCGSPLPFINKKKTSLIIPAGSLDNAIKKTIQANIFVSEEACWLAGSLNAKRYDGFPE